MEGPTRGASEPGSSTWLARPGAARLIRILVFLIPFLASLLATWLVRPLLPSPNGLAETALFLVALVVTAIAAAACVERLARRLLPLASLLELTLVFPDQAPSRYGTALRAGTAKQLAAQIADVKANRFSPDPGEGPQQILALVEALRHHEPLTRGHTERVRAFTALIAQEMGMSSEAQWRLQWAVLLHDIGKLAVPAQILNKDGALTADEWAIVRRHPAVGAHLVAPLEGWLGDFVHAAGQHHEKFDGSGYPNGLAGADISLAGRIVAVADAYDVITSARSYKTPMSAEAARHELVDCAGSHFDPDVVKAMLQASIGKVSGRSGRFSWLTHLDALFQPGAFAAGAGSAAVGVVMTGVALVASPVTGVERDVETAAPTSIPFADEDSLDDGPREPTTTVTRRSTTTSTAQEATTTEPATTLATTTTVAPPSSTATSTPSTRATATLPSTSLAETTTTPPPLTACDELRSGAATDFGGLDLSGCDLRGANLSEVNLAGVNLQDADLTGATISFFNLQGAQFGGATLDGVSLVDGSTIGADMGGVSAENATFTRVDVGSTNLSGADLSGSDFTQMSFGFADLTNAQLDKATFNVVNFNDANLAGANLAGSHATATTEFFRTTLTTVNFQGTNLEFMIFGDSNLTGAVGVPLNIGAGTFYTNTCLDGSVSNGSCW